MNDREFWHDRLKKYKDPIAIITLIRFRIDRYNDEILDMTVDKLEEVLEKTEEE